MTTGASGRSNRHHALDHLRDCGRRKAVIAMSALAFHGKQIPGDELREVAARGLRRHAGNGCEFGRCERPTVHQSDDHARPRRVADKRADTGKGVGRKHAAFLLIAPALSHIAPECFDHARSIAPSPALDRGDQTEKH
jgi:hypothetical protein